MAVKWIVTILIQCLNIAYEGVHFFLAFLCGVFLSYFLWRYLSHFLLKVEVEVEFSSHMLCWQLSHINFRNLTATSSLHIDARVSFNKF